jgi:hypothetical protein
MAQVHADRCSGQESGVGSQGGRGEAAAVFTLNTQLSIVPIAPWTSRLRGNLN